MSITITDRMLREIEIYKNIFYAQYSKYIPDSGWTYPTILDKGGNDGIDGKYICSMNIYSDVELFEIQSFKGEITKRYESTLNHSLLKADLLEIRESATEAIKFYDENLAGDAKIVKDFEDKQKGLSFAERMEFVDNHKAIITILSYTISQIYLGANSGYNVNIGNFKYIYPPVNNSTIAIDCCLQIVEFIDKLPFSESLLKTSDNADIFATPLKSLFKEASKYNAVINLMVSDGKILKTSDGLQWHGYKRNAKYEAVAFLELLSANGWLNKKISGYECIIEILTGTFSGFTCSDKTARNTKINTVSRPMYEALLNSI